MTSEWQSRDYAPVCSTLSSALFPPHQNFYGKGGQRVGGVDGVGGGRKKEGEDSVANPTFLL